MFPNEDEDDAVEWDDYGMVAQPEDFKAAELAGLQQAPDNLHLSLKGCL